MKFTNLAYHLAPNHESLEVIPTTNYFELKVWRRLYFKYTSLCPPLPTEISNTTSLATLDPENQVQVMLYDVIKRNSETEELVKRQEQTILNLRAQLKNEGIGEFECIAEEGGKAK